MSCNRAGRRAVRDGKAAACRPGCGAGAATARRTHAKKNALRGVARPLLAGLPGGADRMRALRPVHDEGRAAPHPLLRVARELLVRRKLLDDEVKRPKHELARHEILSAAAHRRRAACMRVARVAAQRGGALQAAEETRKHVQTVTSTPRILPMKRASVRLAQHCRRPRAAAHSTRKRRLCLAEAAQSETCPVSACIWLLHSALGCASHAGAGPRPRLRREARAATHRAQPRAPAACAPQARPGSQPTSKAWERRQSARTPWRAMPRANSKRAHRAREAGAACSSALAPAPARRVLDRHERQESTTNGKSGPIGVGWRTIAAGTAGRGEAAQLAFATLPTAQPAECTSATGPGCPRLKSPPTSLARTLERRLPPVPGRRWSLARCRRRRPLAQACAIGRPRLRAFP